MSDVTKLILKDKKGEDHSYIISIHGAASGLKLQAEMINLLGASIPAIIQELKEDSNDPLMFGMIIDNIVMKLTPDKYLSIVMQLLENTSRDAQKLTSHVFDTAYAANYKELYRVLAEILRINFFSEFSIGDLTKNVEAKLSRAGIKKIGSKDIKGE